MIPLPIARPSENPQIQRVDRDEERIVRPPDAFTDDEKPMTRYIEQPVEPDSGQPGSLSTRKLFSLPGAGEFGTFGIARVW